MDLSHIKTLIDAMAATDLAEMSCSHAGWTLTLQRFPRGVPRDPAASSAPPTGPGRSAGVEAAGAAAPNALLDAPLDPPADAAAPPPPADTLCCAPMYGVVHLQPAPQAAPFVRVGDTVQAGQTLCVLEAMKVFNTVQAESAGRIEAVLVASGEEVEAGQALMRLVRL